VYAEATGKLIAHGSTTCIVLSPNEARSQASAAPSTA
jgi:hypothetical protein